MPKQIIRYKCNYCKKAYASKSAANKHENRCFHNEAVKSCVTCNNQSFKQDCNDDPISYCHKTGRVIFHKGYPVSKCYRWEPIEIIEEETQDDF